MTTPAPTPPPATAAAGPAARPGPHDDKPAKRRRLGKHLVKRGHLAKDQVREALEEQRRTGGRLGEILVARGDLDPATLCVALAQQSGFPSLGPGYEAVRLLPRSVAFEHRATALLGPSGPAGPDAPVLVAVTDLDSVPALAAALGRPVEPRLADARTMDSLLADAYADADADDARTALSRRQRRRRLEWLGGGTLVAALATGGALLPRRLALGAAAAGVGVIGLVDASARVRRRRARPAAQPPRPAGDAAAGAAVDRLPPVCTVLVPLSAATPAVLTRLRDMLEQLDYPIHRLQGVALIDAADRVTRRSLRTHPLPDWVTPITAAGAAAGGPRGLLLYGLRQASGELVAVARQDGALGSGVIGRVAAAAPGEKTALVADDPGQAAGRRHLTQRFLHEAEPTWLETLARGSVGMPQRPPAVFRTAELRTAFGWDAVARSR